MHECVFVGLCVCFNVDIVVRVCKSLCMRTHPHVCDNGAALYLYVCMLYRYDHIVMLMHAYKCGGGMCVDVCASVYTCAAASICVYACLCAFMHACVCSYMHACVCIDVPVYKCACV